MLLLRFWGVVTVLVASTACRPQATTGAGNAHSENPQDLAEVPEDAYPGQLRPISEIPENFVLRQQLVGTSHGQTFRGETVLQKQGDTLTLIGMSPFGTRAFTLTQVDTDLDYQELLPDPLPFPARFMLLDIHRTLFVGLAGPLANGQHTADIAGERVTEDWAQGRLQRRVFSRLDGEPKGQIVVEYEGGYLPGEAPPTVRLNNQWFGYQLEVKTLMFQAI